jgi:hypothetical protein
MRKPSKVVPIDSVKRKVITHGALSTPEEEIRQTLHCRSRSNRIDFFLRPLLSSRKVRPGRGSRNNRLVHCERAALTMSEIRRVGD